MIMKSAKAIFGLALCMTLGAGFAGLSLAAPQTAPTPTQAVQMVDTRLSYPDAVLELFTSQGCSSCPRANKFVREIATAEPNVLALSYSVDYWDYLGWKDTLSKPEFSARQRQYGKSFNGQVYTPQMVINGAKHKSRFSKAQIGRQVLTRGLRPISISKDGLRVSVDTSSFAAPVTVMAVRYTLGEQSVSVGRGENRGRTIKLANVVTACKKLGTGKPGKEFSAALKALPAGEAYAILVQSKDGGPVLAAANYLP